ncbi:MAG: UDP-N-acetylmuramoyl-L-alanine--D-glutamate ligase [Bacteroidota bacterium]|nr:UDP-N-acetylmuramoyl-L-alanine--D-glutamate ligase [Bacteroidota bacterium]
MENFEKIKISVIGALRSGVASAELLKSLGAIVFVSDMTDAAKLQDSVKMLEASGIDYECGSHTDKVFDCSLMIISPGVPSNAKVVIEAHRRNIKVISELEAASWFCKSSIIAVTGSNGKTTTASLIGEIFKIAGKKHEVAGNIGIAFSRVVKNMDEDSTAILEVSSFQLDHIDKFRPNISAILNITADHMDRYDNSMEKYSVSKARIFMNQTAEDVLIYNHDDEIVKRIVQDAKCKLMPFSVREELSAGSYLHTKSDGAQSIIIKHKNDIVELIDVEDIYIKGVHNVYNSIAASLAAYAAGIENDVIARALKSFKGVEHRLEFVRELKGVKYINDSKATNVDSVWYAINAINEPIVLLLGGRDKGNDYSKLFKPVQEKVKAIIAIGESADKVCTEFREFTEIKITYSMTEAIQKAFEISVAGDVVLLSPACASFDWFENYEHRGKVFKELVNKL